MASTPPPTASVSRPPDADIGRAYEHAVSTIGLISGEVYERFKGILTLHGFVLAAIGVIATRPSPRRFADGLLVILPVVGFLVARLGRALIRLGVKNQETFRSRARDIERAYIDPSLWLFVPLQEARAAETSGVARGDRSSAFERIAGRLSLVLEALYALVFAAGVVRILLLATPPSSALHQTLTGWLR